MQWIFEMLLPLICSLEPGPPAVFRHDAVYNARVDLSWKPPCEPNGKITEYEIKYGRTSVILKKQVIVTADEEKYVVRNLAISTAYSFQIRARNSMGYGPPKTFVVETKGPAGKFFMCLNLH